MTFFGSADPFLPIPDDKRVLTGHFLKASRVILPFFDKFGSSFKLVKNDVEGNINKIDKRYQQDPEKYKTLNDILEETNEKGDKVLKDAHIGAIWLTRGLDFIQAMLVEIFKDYREGGDRKGNTSDLIYKAYERTLCKHHGIIMKNIFKPLCKLAPTKADLLTKLRESEDATDDKVIEDMQEYHKSLAETAVVIQEAIDNLNNLGLKE